MQRSTTNKRKANAGLGRTKSAVSRVTKKRRIETNPVEKRVTQPIPDPSAHLQEKLGFTLLTSEIDRPELIRVDELARIPGHYAIFAKTDIPAGTVFAQYTGTVLSAAKLKKAKDEIDNSYHMHLNSKTIIDARLEGNFSRLANHSEHAANVEFVEMKDPQGNEIIGLRTLIDIPEGKQLLVDYSESYIFPHSTYIYLNPDDNNLSAEDFYNQHKDMYTIFDLDENFLELNLKIGDKIASPNLLGDPLPPNAANFPFFKIEKGKIVSWQEFDCFSPLILAAYGGDVPAAKFLIKNNADINRQQHRSGLTPLHFAMFGYRETKGAPEFMEIIKLLIANSANLLITDDDDIPAIYDAMLHFRPEDLKEILAMIPDETFTKILQLVDESLFDLISTAINEKLFENLEVLLQKAPNYLKDNYRPEKIPKHKGAKNKKYFYDMDHFNSLIKKYRKTEMEKLLAVLSNYNMPKNYLTRMENSIAIMADRENHQESSASQSVESSSEMDEEIENHLETTELLLPSTPNEPDEEAARQSLLINHGLFGTISVNIHTVLNNFEKRIEEIRKKEEFLDQCVKPDMSTLDAENLQRSSANNIQAAERLLRKLEKYEKMFTAPDNPPLKSDLKDKIRQMKVDLEQIISPDVKITFIKPGK